MRSVERRGGGSLEAEVSIKNAKAEESCFTQLSVSERRLRRRERGLVGPPVRNTPPTSLPREPWRSQLFTGTAPADTASSISHAILCGHKYLKLCPGDVCCHDSLWITDLACERKISRRIITGLGAWLLFQLCNGTEYQVCGGSDELQLT